MSAFHATKPLTAQMEMRIREIDPKMACGSGTTVREFWEVTADGQPPHEAHQVFIDRHGIYCGRCGRDCASVAVVENERAKQGREAVRHG